MISNSDIFLEERENDAPSETDWQQAFNNPDNWEKENLYMIDQAEHLKPLKPFETGLKKSDIKEMASKAVESILSHGDPLKAAESASLMQNFLENFKGDARFVDYVREEAAKHNKHGYTSASGAKIECCEVGTSYDFINCNDPEYKAIVERFEQAKKALKERETFLKTVPLKGMDVRYGDELVTIYPPVKNSISSFKVTLAK